MPGGPGQPVQVFPERPGGVALKMAVGPPPGNPQDSVETFPLPDPVDKFGQSLLSFPPDDHIDPGVAARDLVIIKRNMRPSPYGNCIGGKTFHFLENFGSRGQIEGKRGNPR